MPSHSLKSLPTLLKIGFVDALAYRAEFLIWILSTTMPLVMLALWNAVAREHPIGRFDQAQLAAYFLTALIIRLLTGMWIVWTLNQEVRQGTFAFRLMRPVHPLIQYGAENLAALPVRGLFALPVAVIALLILGTGQLTRDPLQLALFVVSVLGAWLLIFIVMAIISCAAFYVESSLGIFQTYNGCYMLLSGYLVPLDFFPPTLRAFCQYLPFRYMLSFPVETLLGHFGRLETLKGLGLQLGWIGVMSLLLVALWRKGMRRFNAYGG